MNLARLLIVGLSAATTLATVAPAQAAEPAIAGGDLAGYTAAPGMPISQVSLTVSVPVATTSADCNTPGTFEYAEFGIRFSPNTFARVDATCGNSGNLAYFGDIEVAGDLKILVLKPGQQVTLGASVSGTTMTISLSRGFTFKQVSGSPGPFASVGLGGTNVPGFDIPVLTTRARFNDVKVNGALLGSVPRSETTLVNGPDVLLAPTAVTSAGAFTVRYLNQS